MMTKNPMASWPRDFETDLPMVPPGEFTTFKEYPNSTQPSRVRKLPVLRGYFDGQRFDTDPALPTHIGWGAVRLDNAVVMTFRVQRGPNVLYWLANPSDPEVWAVLDKWAAAKTMVLAAEFKDGQAFVIRRDFDLEHPGFNRLRRTLHESAHTMNFIADVTRELAGEGLKSIASTDIPAYPLLQHVQGCMVRTEHTGGVALMLSDKAPSDRGPVADAIAALAQAMLKPEEKRH